MFRVIIILSFVITSAFNLKANDTLTIREAFNWKIGDTLIYKQFNCNTYPIAQGAPPELHCSHYGLYGFKVISRTDSNDSIFFIVQWFTNEMDSLVLNNVDESVVKYGFAPMFNMMFHHIGNSFSSGFCVYLEDMPTCDSFTVSNCDINISYDTTNNSLLINKIDMLLFETGYSITYLEDIGIKEVEYFALEYGFGSQGGCGFSLIYHKSDSTMWVDSSLLYTDVNNIKTNEIDFTIHPNPTNSNFTVALPPATKQITITNTMGQVVQAQTINKEATQLDIALAESGTYFVHVTTESATVTKKVICISAFK